MSFKPSVEANWFISIPGRLHMKELNIYFPRLFYCLAQILVSPNFPMFPTAILELAVVDQASLKLTEICLSLPTELN